MRKGGALGVNVQVFETTICEVCGKPFVFFYNAGQPVMGCKNCRDNKRIIYSNHTIEAADSQMVVYTTRTYGGKAG